MIHGFRMKHDRQALPPPRQDAPARAGAIVPAPWRAASRAAKSAAGKPAALMVCRCCQTERNTPRNLRRRDARTMRRTWPGSNGTGEGVTTATPPASPLVPRESGCKPDTRRLQPGNRLHCAHAPPPDSLRHRMTPPAMPVAPLALHGVASRPLLGQVHLCAALAGRLKFVLRLRPCRPLGHDPHTRPPQRRRHPMT